MSKELKRNDPCHCGSGSKYKNCHAKSGPNKSLPWLFWGLLLALIVVFSLFPDNQENGLDKQYTSKPYLPQKLGKSKPEGDTPPGKVWSAEHGHWHDSKDHHNSFKINTKENGDELQNQVEAPPGKVWSAEHGHWHDEK